MADDGRAGPAALGEGQRERGARRLSRRRRRGKGSQLVIRQADEQAAVADRDRGRLGAAGAHRGL